MTLQYGVISGIPYDMQMPKSFSHSQPSREFWRWATENQPRHRRLQMKDLPIRNRNKIRDAKLNTWKRLLDHLVSKGWAQYVILWTHDGKMLIFEEYQLQGVRNEIRRSSIG